MSCGNACPPISHPVARMARTTSGSFASASADTISFGSLWSKMSSAIRVALFSSTIRSTSVENLRLLWEKAAYFVPSKPYSAKPLVSPTPSASSCRIAAVCAADKRGTKLDSSSLAPPTVVSARPITFAAPVASSIPPRTTPPLVANFTPLVATPVGSVLIITRASRTPDIMLYGSDLGLNTKFAAPRPTVHAEPSIVPRYLRARSACLFIKS